MRDAGKSASAALNHLQTPSAAAASQAAATPSEVLLDLLEGQLSQLVEMAGADAAGVHVVDDHEPVVLRLYAQQGLTPEEQRAAMSADLQGSLVGRCALSRSVLARPGHEGPLAGWERAATAIIAQPVNSDGHTLGCLWCLSRDGALAPEAAAVAGLVAGSCAHLILRHYLHRRLESERGEYRQLLNHLRDPVWTICLEPEFRTVLVSRGIETLTGYAPEEFLAEPALWLGMVYPDDRDIVMQDVQRVQSGDTNEIHHRLRIIRKDGEIRWAHTRARADKWGDELRLYGLTTDVTEHVQLEKKVRRADRLSAVGMLAGGIAHEYNNLHFAILGTLDLLLMREDFDEGVRQHINRVREAAERASDITTKLVSFARGGSGGRAVLDVSELVDSALTLVKKEFSTQGITVETRYSPLPLQVEGNQAELGQALINLIINAQQAMQGRPTQRLTISTGLCPERRVFISIADTGHGVSPENLPRVFDPFFTTKGAAGSWLEGRAASDALIAGRGLGLSVAQTIVQEHGGDIEVDSQVDCGARFTVFLPSAQPVADLPTTVVPGICSTTGRILIADDEAPVREVCREMLEHLKYEVAEAGGGAQALRMLQGEVFDLVLVDLQMPDMGGLELIGHINQIPAERRPAKLIITGNIDEVPPETCADLGISGLLQKTASLSELVTKVQLALGSRQG